jgi:hypothetical protein
MLCRSFSALQKVRKGTLMEYRFGCGGFISDHFPQRIGSPSKNSYPNSEENERHIHYSRKKVLSDGFSTLVPG